MSGAAFAPEGRRLTSSRAHSVDFWLERGAMRVRALGSCCVDLEAKRSATKGCAGREETVLELVPRFDDAGKPIEAEVTEHNRVGRISRPSRLVLWQIQCVGRWGGSTVEHHITEAFAEIRADWAIDGFVQSGPNRAMSEESQCAHLWEVMEDLCRLSAVVEDVVKCIAHDGRTQTTLCDEMMAFVDRAARPRHHEIVSGTTCLRLVHSFAGTYTSRGAVWSCPASPSPAHCAPLGNVHRASRTLSCDTWASGGGGGGSEWRLVAPLHCTCTSA